MLVQGATESILSGGFDLALAMTHACRVSEADIHCCRLHEWADASASAVETAAEMSRECLRILRGRAHAVLGSEGRISAQVSAAASYAALRSQTALQMCAA